MKEDLTNKKFFKWTVVDYAGQDTGHRSMWRCVCECGVEQLVQGYQLTSGKSKSCKWCSHAGINATHGLSKTKIFNSYYGLVQRTSNKNNEKYPQYGGRGIKNEWKCFEDFVIDMYPSFLVHVSEHGAKNTSLDRIDVNGNYCKDNCRWATAKEQANNKTCHRMVTFNGETKNVAQWATHLGIPVARIRARLIKLGWSDDRALSLTKWDK